MTTNSNPYVGPRSFEIGDSLYGRERELRSLSALLIAERIVLLHSPSGAGKTSLLQAGLITLMREEGFNVLPVIRVNAELPEGISANRYAFSTMLSLDDQFSSVERLPYTDLAALELDQYLQTRLPEEDTLLIFDQFEEILTLSSTDRENKQAFFLQLGEALRSKNLWALFSIREDYLGGLAPYVRPIPNRLDTKFRLDLLSTDAAMQAIRRPAENAGVDFTQAAAKKLVDDLRRVQVQAVDGEMESVLGEYVEPVQLQVVCYRLWEGHTLEKVEIDESDLAAVQSVDQSLAEYYAESVKKVANETGVEEREVREWFEQKLITKEGIRAQVLRGKENSETLKNQAVEKLENAHIIRSEVRAGKNWYELSHDRLVEPMRNDNQAWFEANLKLFQRQAILWNEKGRSEGLLLRGKEFSDAAKESKMLPHLTDDEQEFLKACHTLRKREQREQRQQRLILIGLIASLFFFALAVIGFVGANQQTQRAEEQAKIAQEQVKIARAGELSTLSEIVRNKNFPLSLLLGLEAFRAKDLFQTRNNLLNNTQANPRLLRFLNTKLLAAFSPDGKMLASSEGKGTILLSDVESGQPIGQPLNGYKNFVGNLAFSPNGKILASAGDYLTIILWDVASQQPIGQRLSGHHNDIYSLAFSPDGKTLASAGCLKLKEASYSDDCVQGEIILWDVASRQPIGQPLTGNHNYVNSVTFSPDGKLLASGSCSKYDSGLCREGEVILWDVSSQQPVSQPLISKDGNDGNVYSVAFNYDGSILAAGTDKTITLWNTSSHQVIGQPLKGHTDYISSLVFVSGNTLASGSGDKTIILWDIYSYKPIGQPFTGAANGIRSIFISSDRKTLISSGGGEIILWNLDTDQSLGQRLGQSDSISSIAFNPSGKLLVTGGWDGSVIQWDVSTGRPVGPPITGHKEKVKSVAFSPDGKMLASGSWDKTIILWDGATGKQIGQPLRGHTDHISSVVFSPDGKLLASGSWDKTVILWDVATGQPIGQPLTVEFGSAVASIAFSPDGKTMAAVMGSVGDIVLWDVATRQPIGYPLVESRSVNSIAFSPDGKILAGGSDDNTIIFWNIATGQKEGLPFVGHTNHVSGVVFTPDGKLIISSSWDGRVILWNVASHKPVEILLKKHFGSLDNIALSPDGKTLASGAYIWDFASRQPINQLHTGNNHAVDSVAYDPDGKRIASTSCGKYNDDEECIQGEIILWDVASPKALGQSLRGHTNTINSIDFSPNGKTIASGSTDQTIILWNVETGQPIGKPLTGHSGSVKSVAFSPDGKIIASGSADHTIRLWNAETGLPIGQPLIGHTDSINGIAFSPDGKNIISGSSDSTLILWDVESHQPVGQPFKGHKSLVDSVDFNPDGKTVASGSNDNTIIIWNVVSHQPIGQPLKERRYPSDSVRFSPDGKFLVSGSITDVVTIWDVATHQQLGQPLTGQYGYIISIAFSPDGKSFVTGSLYSNTFLWNMDPVFWIERSCFRAGRNFTRNEWTQYFPNDPYRATCSQWLLESDAAPNASPTP